MGAKHPLKAQSYFGNLLVLMAAEREEPNSAYPQCRMPDGSPAARFGSSLVKRALGPIASSVGSSAGSDG